MDCPAEVSDVQGRYFRTLTDAEEAVIGTRLEDAWLDLQDLVTDLVDRLEAEPADEVLLARTKRTLAEAVIRLLNNPFGRKQESRGIDDAQRSWTLAEALASGELYFTDAELDRLRSDDSTDYRGKAFSVMPSFDSEGEDDGS